MEIDIDMSACKHLWDEEYVRRIIVRYNRK